MRFCCRCCCRQWKHIGMQTTTFFPPFHALVMNSWSVLNESRTDHLILIGCVSARVAVHGPRSDSVKTESCPANKKWTVRRVMAALKCICPLQPLMSNLVEKWWHLLNACALKQEGCTFVCVRLCMLSHQDNTRWLTSHGTSIKSQREPKWKRSTVTRPTEV